MSDVILIISEPGDLHALAMASILKNEYLLKPYHLYMEDFPTSSKGVFKCKEKPIFNYEGRDGNLCLKDVRSIWWRRPHPITIPQTFNEFDRSFMQAECDHFLQGALWGHDCLWVNDPVNNYRASRKLFQLTMARKVGLKTPTTIVTNDPDEARSFIDDSAHRTIFMRTGASPGVLTKTCFVTPEVSKRLDSIMYSPTTFQEYIDAYLDFRVIWIDDQLWAVSIDSQSGASPEDCRFDNTVEFRKYELPNAIQKSLSDLMRSLGLIFGAIDLRLGNDGEYYFLEVNPAGQFAYLELKTGIPLMNELASVFARGLH